MTISYKISVQAQISEKSEFSVWTCPQCTEMTIGIFSFDMTVVVKNDNFEQNLK